METKRESNHEPRGFSEHTRKRSSENAHELGWGLNEDERRRIPNEGRKGYGSTDYACGAQDFGDEASRVSAEATAKDRSRFSGQK